MLFSVQTINVRFLLFRLEMNAFYILVEITRSESTALFTVLLNLVTARYSDFLFDYKILTELISPVLLEGSVWQVIGDNNLVMGSSHIAHDCKIGNNNIFANNTLFAGHVVVEVSNNFTIGSFFSSTGLRGHFLIKKYFFQDWTHTAGAVVVHQFCHIGSYSFLGGGSVVCFLYKFDLHYLLQNFMVKMKLHVVLPTMPANYEKNVLSQNKNG